jgi:metal-responsive CopG/Arc/MetJ family transcriptional regulator
VPEELNIRINLDGKLAEEFLFLKAKRGLKASTELIRQLITEAYNQETKEASAE